jgi:hypothetical protein
METTVALNPPIGIHTIKSDRIKTTLLDLAKSIYLIVIDTNDKLTMTITNKIADDLEFYIFKCHGFSQKSIIELSTFLGIAEKLRIHSIYMNKNQTSQETTISFKIFPKESVDVIYGGSQNTNITLGQIKSNLGELGRKYRKALRPSKKTIILSKKSIENLTLTTTSDKNSTSTSTLEEYKKTLLSTVSIHSKEQIKKFISNLDIFISNNISMILNNLNDIPIDIVEKINEIRFHMIEEQFCDSRLVTIIEDVKKSQGKILQINIKIKFDELDHINLKKLSTNDFAKDSKIDFVDYALLFTIESEMESTSVKRLKI